MSKTQVLPPVKLAQEPELVWPDVPVSVVSAHRADDLSLIGKVSVRRGGSEPQSATSNTQEPS